MLYLNIEFVWLFVQHKLALFTIWWVEWLMISLSKKMYFVWFLSRNSSCWCDGQRWNVSWCIYLFYYYYSFEIKFLDDFVTTFNKRIFYDQTKPSLFLTFSVLSFFLPFNSNSNVFFLFTNRKRTTRGNNLLIHYYI